MDFFARQDRARAQTAQLLGLFVFSVGVVVAVITLVLVVVIGSNYRDPDLLVGSSGWWIAQAPLSAACAAGVLFVVLAGTAYKLLMLQGGGAVVARSMGGDLVDANTTDPLQRRLLNVVEEMAMASGVPVPAVYVLGSESAINAFAAGHTPADSVVAVTRGALEKLDRAELQGVIGHEFSHILNGDMRLNMRLLGLVAGLFAVATVGRVLMRAGRGRKGGPIVVAGLAMFALGWIGVLLGRMIQAAISRQREFLADASSVQFTRDPTGLKEALVKIGDPGSGSRLAAHETGDVAHMLFASGLNELFDTHPPLEERIRALDPSFTPEVIARERERLAKRASAAAAAAVQSAASAPGATAGRLAAAIRGVPGAAAGGALLAGSGFSDLVARPRLVHLDYAAQLRAALPPALLADAGDPQRAVEALWALLLGADETASARQLEVLASAYPPDTLLGVRQRRDTLAAVAPALRMPLLMRLFPALGRRPVGERQALLDLMSRVIAADGAISISEYAFARLARLHLDEQLAPPAAASELPADQLEPELQIVFSVLAHCGQGDPGFAERAFDRGMTQVLAVPHTHYEPPSDWVPAMDRALARLDQMRLNDKARLVEGLAAVVSEDGRLDVEEAELLRAICGSLHCPLPPLMLGDGTAALAG